MCPTRSEKFRTSGNFCGIWLMADVRRNPWSVVKNMWHWAWLEEKDGEGIPWGEWYKKN